MGWLYMESIRPHRTPKEYLDHQFTYENERIVSRVLASAVVKLRTYYAAVEVVFKDSQKREVYGLVCLLEYRKRGFKDGMTFGYKDMSEEAGPYATECPARILDLLTPTDNEYAQQWRERCRAHLAVKLPRPGQTIRLAHPLTFTDNSTHDTFKAVRNGSKTVYYADGVYYKIRNLRDREFTILS